MYFRYCLSSLVSSLLSLLSVLFIFLSFIHSYRVFISCSDSYKVVSGSVSPNCWSSVIFHMTLITKGVFFPSVCYWPHEYH
jgi:hypothetical protein